MWPICYPQRLHVDATDGVGGESTGDPSCGSEATQPQSPQSSLVYIGSDGKLTYVPDAKGNTVLDFSFAGYGGGGVPLPTVEVKNELAPNPTGDDRARIRAALDELGSMPNRRPASAARCSCGAEPTDSARSWS